MGSEQKMQDYANLEELFRNLFYYCFNKAQKKLGQPEQNDKNNVELIKEKYGKFRCKIMKAINQSWERRNNGSKSIRGTEIINEAISVFNPSGDDVKHKIADFYCSNSPLKTEILDILHYLLFHKNDKEQRASIRNIVSKLSKRKNSIPKKDKMWEFEKLIYSGFSTSGAHRFKIEEISPHFLQRMRIPDIEDQTFSKKGKYKSEKKRKWLSDHGFEQYDTDVYYESTPECKVYQGLENSKEVVFYQEQPVKIPYRYREKSTYYTPDAFVLIENNYAMLLEVKINLYDWRVLYKKNIVKWCAMEEYCSNLGLGYLVSDGHFSMRNLLIQYCLKNGIEIRNKDTIMFKELLGFLSDVKINQNFRDKIKAIIDDEGEAR